MLARDPLVHVWIQVISRSSNLPEQHWFKYLIDHVQDYPEVTYEQMVQQTNYVLQHLSLNRNVSKLFDDMLMMRFGVVQTQEFVMINVQENIDIEVAINQFPLNDKYRIDFTVYPSELYVAHKHGFTMNTNNKYLNLGPNNTGDKIEYRLVRFLTGTNHIYEYRKNRLYRLQIRNKRYELVDLPYANEKVHLTFWTKEYKA